MPKRARELKPVEIARLAKKPEIGFHPVGGVPGLALVIKGENASSWILRVMVGSKRRDYGLGGWPEVPLVRARELARELREQIRNGADPVSEKRAARSARLREQAKQVTFKALAAEYATKKGKEFKAGRQEQKLTGMLERYAYPKIGKLLVADIERAHVLAMLEPIWETMPETAGRVRRHVERILDLATVKGLRNGDNPAKWAGNLSESLPAHSKIAKVQHHAALAVDTLADFLKELREVEGIPARALEFIILTAARSGEVRGAVWSEFDLKKHLWTIPVVRMKAGRTHTVPLSADAVKLLQSLPRFEGCDLVFPNTRAGLLSDVVISKVVRRLGHDVTVHGFRSTFKDWARKHTGFPDEVSELALAHVNSDATRAAYARDELLDKRRQMMEAWADFARYLNTKPVSGDKKVVGIREGKA
jgi:integrase